MASILKVDDLRGNTSAGDITITSEGGSATMQLQQGLAKTWVNFNGTGTIAARDSLNVSGLVDNGTGDYTVTISNDMNNTNYCLSGASGDATNANQNFILGTNLNYSVGSCRIRTGSGSGYGDNDFVNVLLHGDLA